jgi:hypothetical protein
MSNEMSPDDHTFEQIYEALPPGLVVVACGGEYFQLLQSFCFSLKRAAIRKGIDAIHFNWNGARENWDSLGGIQHFRDFIEPLHLQGVRLFLIDGTPRSGSPTHRIAELIRSPMALGSIDQDIAELIHQEALSKGVTVVVTALAEVVAAEQVRKALEGLDSAMHEKQAGLNEMRGGMAEIERQFRLADAQAAIAALPKDIAEQIRGVREALPGAALKIKEIEAQIAELGRARKGLTRKRSTTQLLALLKTNLYSGAWKGILLEQHRVDDDWYSATVATGLEVEGYGPLYFVWECPQPPVTPPQPESRAGVDNAPAEATVQRRPSWLRRLFGPPGV